MFSSTILDVIIGLVSLFLAVSLIASAITEGLSTLLSLRATTLLDGVKKLLNDPGLTGLAGAVYAHALVNPLSSGTSAGGAPGAVVSTPSTIPSYIKATGFATALIDSIQKDAGVVAGQAATLSVSIAAIKDPQIKAALSALYARADGDVNVFHDYVAHWFDGAMDRVSGTYKRYVKVITFAVGLIAAVALNADPIHVSETVWQRPVVAQKLENIQPPAGTASSEVQAKQMLQEIDAAGPLMGWNGFATTDPRAAGLGLVLMILGWLITGCATLFGAPFWFDILQRFVQVRGTGKPVTAAPPNA